MVPQLKGNLVLNLNLPIGVFLMKFKNQPIFIIISIIILLLLLLLLLLYCRSIKNLN